MENVNSAQIITQVKQYKIQSTVVQTKIILMAYLNLLNTLKETLNMYQNGRFYAQLLHKKTIEELRSNSYCII